MSLRTRLTLAVAYVLLLALIAFGVPLAVGLSERVDSEVRVQAQNEAQLVAAGVPARLDPDGRATLRRLVDSAARAQRGRVIVVDEAGRVTADSSGAADLGAGYGSRPEIAAALRGEDRQEVRESRTLGTQLLATAVPVLRAGGTAGAVRVTQSVDAVDRAITRSVLGLAGLGGVVLALGLVAGALIARDTAQPIRRLEQAAERVEAGDLAATATVEGSSEQRALARSFNKMTSRLGRLLRGQQEFVADASHQLRTPLAGIRLQIEDVREETPDADPRASALDAGLDEVDRLSEIINELLILSRAGEHERPGERIALADAVEAARARWHKSARERGVRLTTEAAGDAGTVLAAPADFDRALDSLIENAIRYSPQGGEVAVRASRGRVEVLDDGPGLEPGEEEAVFERFYRGSAGRRAAGGTGLGLPIARELAGQWDGGVRIESRQGGGARAVIELPPEPAAVSTGGRPL